MSTTRNQKTASQGPSIAEIRTRVQQVFRRCACLWQCKPTEAIAKGQHVFIDVGTGMGKTMSFLMPALFAKNNEILVVISPLNILGKQTTERLEEAGIAAITISAETATERNFRAIEEGHYRVVIINPEQVMKAGGGFERLLRKASFVAKILAVVLDEAHCSVEWGGFRPEYQELGQLRYRLPSVPFVFASATFTPTIRHEIKRLFHLEEDRTTYIRLPGDRPNIHLGVHRIRYSMKSFRDLAFLVPKAADGSTGQTPPPKFVVFFDNIAESVRAARYLRKLLPYHLRHKIKWFHSQMSTQYKESTVRELRDGLIWGLCATDSFGMGVDLPDIDLVIQWRATCSMTALWQRLGRAARDHRRTGIGLLFVEAKYLDEIIKQRALAKEQRRLAALARAAKRKSTQSRGDPPGASSKRRRMMPPPPPLSPSRVTNVSESASHQFISTAFTSSGLMTHSTIPFPTTPASNSMPSSPTHPMLPSTILLPSIPIRAPSAVQVETQNTANAVHPAMSRVDLRERQQEYLAHSKDVIGRTLVKRAGTQELSPEMMDFINAEGRGLGCRRKPILWYFDMKVGAAGSDHLECDHSSPTGCTHCFVPPPAICCDIHHPQSFAHLHLPGPATQNETSVRRSTFKAFTYGARDLELRDALRSFAQGQVKAKFGPGQLILFGHSLVLPDEIISRIVAAAHYSKLKTLADLQRQTQPWAVLGILER